MRSARKINKEIIIGSPLSEEQDVFKKVSFITSGRTASCIHLLNTTLIACLRN